MKKFQLLTKFDLNQIKNHLRKNSKKIPRKKLKQQRKHSKEKAKIKITKQHNKHTISLYITLYHFKKL